jgi:hypothetical protein
MLQRIWEQNKNFLLVAGSGFALFLILNSCVGSYVRRPEAPGGLYAQASKLEKDIRRLEKEVSSHAEVKALLAAYEEEEAALRAEIEPAPEKEVATFDEVNAFRQFDQAIDRVWAEALELANRANVALPEKPGIQDFGVRREDRKSEYEDHYAYLGILRRAVGALIDSGMVEIGRPELLDPDYLPVAEIDGATLCLFRAVRFQVSGPYESFVRVFQTVQSPKDFIQVRLGTLAPKAKDQDQVLKGQLDFVGIWLVPRESVEKDGTAGGRARPARKRSSRG